MKYIICIGNRLVPEDAAGGAVYDLLTRRLLPPGVAVVEGGLAGLNLLRYFDDAETVVLVDAVSGFTGENRVVVLTPDEIIPLAAQCFDHGAGLPYLLGMLPAVMEGPIPKTVIIGLEGPADPALIEKAAQLALQHVDS